jgi:hypothetical protein
MNQELVSHTSPVILRERRIESQSDSIGEGSADPSEYKEFLWNLCVILSEAKDLDGRSNDRRQPRKAILTARCPNALCALGAGQFLISGR